MNRQTLRRIIEKIDTPDAETKWILTRAYGRPDEPPAFFRRLLRDVIFHVLSRTEDDDYAEMTEQRLRDVLHDYTTCHSVEPTTAELVEWLAYPGAIDAVDTVLQLHDYNSSLMLFSDALDEYCKSIAQRAFDAVEKVKNG